MRLFAGTALGLVVVLVSCGAPKPVSQSAPTVSSAAASASAASRPSEPPDEPLPKLRTGSLEPEQMDGVRDLRLVGRHVANGIETLSAELGEAESFSWRIAVSVDASPGGAAPAFSFVAAAPGSGRSVDRVWIRRPVSDQPAAGDLFFPASGSKPGRHARFRVGDTQKAPSDPAVRVAWLRALADVLGGPVQRTPWSVFASERLKALAESLDPKPKAKSVQRAAAGAPRVRLAPSRPPAHDELAELMEITTGATAVQEALQQDRTLFLEASKEPATIPIAALEPPTLEQHPWSKMLSSLGPVPIETFAASTPAEFYYVRAADFPALLQLLDQVDAWGTPAANVLDEVSEERDLSSRYEGQLGLQRGPLTRALGGAVVGEVAVMGSDPYLKEGSDVTLLLRVKSRALFDAALAATMADLEKAHRAISRSKRVHGGVAVSVARSADGFVAQQRASVDDVEVVSNSPAAMDIVLDAMQGRHARLADEPDFRFMLARDSAERADVLAYLGDRFVGTVVGPRQKVLEARRAIALSELMTPGLAALLYGVMQGRTPDKVEDLVAAGLLKKEELSHVSGARIDWKPGSAARSTWGTLAAATPLVDLPAPATVTASEKASYERFARGYQYDWAAYIDPVALRFAFDGKTVRVSMRELPLIDGTKYREIAGFVGTAGFSAPAVVGGMRLVAGIGADSEPRRDLTQTLRGLSSHPLKFDWVGDWAAAGLADRAVVAKFYRAFDRKVPEMPAPERPDRARRDRDLLEQVPQLPIYAELAVKSAAQAALALAAVRLLANETIPGMFEWGEASRYRDVPIVRVALKKELTQGLVDDAPEVTVYCAVTQGALLLTLQPWLMERLVDEQLDGTGPTVRHGAGGPPERATQLSLDVGSDPGKALWSMIAWGLESEMLRSSAASAQSLAGALLRGAPENAFDAAAIRDLALAYFGAIPVSPDGGTYTLAKEGIRDPARGTHYAPIWPALPVAGSPVARVLQALAHVRTDVAFDEEGKNEKGDVMRSLSARATFGLR